jgi:hypothetical protein
VIEEAEPYMVVAVVDFEEDTLVEDFDKEIEAYMYLNDLKNYFGKDFVGEDIDFVEHNFEMEVEVDMESVVAYKYLNVEDFVEESFAVVVNSYCFGKDFVEHMYLIYENYFY